MYALTVHSMVLFCLCSCMYDDKDDDDDKVRVMVHYCYMRGGFTDGKTGKPGAYQDDVNTRWNSYYIWVPVVLVGV